MIEAPPQFWRMDPPEIDDDGLVIRGGMWEHQREWWQLENFVRVLVGGYGSGKTLVLCKRMVSLALINAPCPVAIVSPTFPMAKETAISTLIEILDGRMSLGDGFYWEDRKTSPYQFFIEYNGKRARILVYSGMEPDRLKGPNLAAAGIDEPFIQHVGVFNQMIARVRHPRAVKLEINLTGTPEQLNWGYELCQGELSEMHDVGYIRGKTSDNRALQRAYVERLLAGYDEKTARAYVGGEFVNLSSGLIYHSFDPEYNVREIARPERCHDWAGMDFNVNPMAFCIGWSKGGHAHITHEYELPNSDTPAACAHIRAVHPYVGHIYPDATGNRRATNAPDGKTDFHYIEEAGFEYHADHRGNPGRRDRFNATNGKLRSATGADGNPGNVTMTIDPRCKKLASYFGQLSYQDIKKQENMTHLTDAASYPVAYQFPVRDRIETMVQVTGA